MPRRHRAVYGGLPGSIKERRQNRGSKRRCGARSVSTSTNGSFARNPGDSKRQALDVFFGESRPDRLRLTVGLVEICKRLEPALALGVIDELELCVAVGPVGFVDLNGV